MLSGPGRSVFSGLRQVRPFSPVFSNEQRAVSDELWATDVAQFHERDNARGCL